MPHELGIFADAKKHLDKLDFLSKPYIILMIICLDRIAVSTGPSHGSDPGLRAVAEVTAPRSIPGPSKTLFAPSKLFTQSDKNEKKSSNSLPLIKLPDFNGFTSAALNSDTKFFFL